MIQLIQKKVESRKSVLENVRRLFSIRNEIIEGFKDGNVFMFKDFVPSNQTKESEQSYTIDTPKLESEQKSKQFLIGYW